MVTRHAFLGVLLVKIGTTTVTTDPCATPLTSPYRGKWVLGGSGQSCTDACAATTPEAGACDSDSLVVQNEQREMEEFKTIVESLGVEIQVLSGVEQIYATCALASCPQIMNPFSADRRRQNGKDVVRDNNAASSTCEAVFDDFLTGQESRFCYCTMPSPCNVCNLSTQYLDDPPCEEGYLVESANNCAIRCLPGYVANVTTTACSESVLDESFACEPGPCTFNGIANIGSPPCTDGAFDLTSGTSCTVQCAVGYVPSDVSVICSISVLYPLSFSCNEQPCDAPSVSNASSPSCTEGDSVASSGICTTACENGYVPDVPSLACSLGVLTPHTFQCMEQQCDIPNADDIIYYARGNTALNGANMKPAPCAGAVGSLIDSGGGCEAHCLQGFQPSVPSLSCNLGVLSPATFTCSEQPCTSPVVGHGGEPSCKEGSVINGGELCTPTCASGYFTTEQPLHCSYGELTPQSFLCQPLPCVAPNATLYYTPQGATWVPAEDQNPCDGEDADIESGSYCIATCEPGYKPSVAALSCSAGTLSPPAFTCSELPCDAPENVSHAAAKSCEEGSEIQSRESCTPKCKEGYAPSEVALDCMLGNLTPSTFVCEPRPCSVPSSTMYYGGLGGDRSISSAVFHPCGEGVDSIRHGEVCTPSCTDGHEPSVNNLNCVFGTFSPPTFSCSEIACLAPAGIIKGAAPSCVEGLTISSGTLCTPACMHGYEPSETSLNCSLGVLHPVTFTCPEAGCVVSPPGNGGCAEGNTIASRKWCTTQCFDTGHVPSYPKLHCKRLRLTPREFTCMPPCYFSSGSLSERAASIPCAEMDENVSYITHGGKCTTQCKGGYGGTPLSLDCLNTALSPASFQCWAPCAIPDVAHLSAQVCAEIGAIGSAYGGPSGDVRHILHGTTCTPQCLPGFLPNVVALTCDDSVLSPPTFHCIGVPCVLPVVELSATVLCLGLEANATYLEHGKTCHGQCVPGYSPTVAALYCDTGDLRPSTFNCTESPCAAPEVLNANVTCVEGSSVESKTTCTTQCFDGYTPSVSSLECDRGVLSPSSFTCHASCSLSGVSRGAAELCAEGMEGNLILHGKNCTAQCVAGFVPSYEQLNCNDGVLSPPSFECFFYKCDMPTAPENAAARPCMEPVVVRGGVCTTDCAFRYTPSVAALTCSRSQLALEPQNFTCYRWCDLPIGVVEHASLDLCADSNNESYINHSDICYLQCEQGYKPSIEFLQCNDGLLEPQNFTCEPAWLQCDIPHGINKAIADPCLEVAEPDHILHGGRCTAQCQAAYTPSPRYLSCSLGALFPSTFSCIYCAEVKLIIAETATPKTQPGSFVGEAVSSDIRDMWCYYACRRLTVQYGSNGLKWVAQGLFRHLPCAEFVEWSSGATLSQADILVITADSFQGLSDTVLLDSGFHGAIVLVDFGCGVLGPTAPVQLQCWAERTLYLGSDRIAAAAYAEFVEAPPGALEIIARNAGGLSGQLATLRATQRPLPYLERKTKFLAYLADDCGVDAERMFDLIYENLRGFGAVEALGRCHGSHPEAATPSCQGSCAAAQQDNISLFEPFRFALIFEQSAKSQRCFQNVNIAVLDALLASAVPVYRGPDGSNTILNTTSLVSVPPWISLEAGLGLLRTVAAASGDTAMAIAPALQSSARGALFAFDKELRGEKTELGAKVVTSLGRIIRGSPSWRCWKYELSKRLN